LISIFFSAFTASVFLAAVILSTPFSNVAWLLPRHAERIVDAIQRDYILRWVKITSPEDEQLTCASLLARSSGPVEVHDLVPLPKAGRVRLH
jgi:hypothetical protein